MSEPAQISGRQWGVRLTSDCTVVDARRGARARTVRLLLVALIVVAAQTVGGAFAPPASASGEGYRSTVLQDAPISYWRLGETTGTTARDETGGNHGTIRGGVSLAQPGAVSGDTSMFFDGTSGFVEIPNEPELRPKFLTAEAWFRSPGKATERQSIFRVRFYGYQIAVNTSGRVEAFACNSPNPMCDTLTTGPVVTDNAWHHFAMTKGGTRIALYLDGQFIGQLTSPGETYYTATDVAIGRDGAGPLYYFKGNLDEVAITTASCHRAGSRRTTERRRTRRPVSTCRPSMPQSRATSGVMRQTR